MGSICEQKLRDRHTLHRKAQGLPLTLLPTFDLFPLIGLPCLVCIGEAVPSLDCILICQGSLMVLGGFPFSEMKERLSGLGREERKLKGEKGGL